jgi:hypothetical protein
MAKRQGTKLPNRVTGNNKARPNPKASQTTYHYLYAYRNRRGAIEWQVAGLEKETSG